DYKKDGITFRFANYMRHYYLCTCDPDESGSVNALSNLKPAKLEFNPHHSMYGGGYFYPLAAALKTASLPGLVRLVPDMRYYFENPDEMGRFYTVARLAGAAAGTLGLLLLLFFFYTRAGGLFWPAVLAALLFLSPVIGPASKTMKPHFPVILFSALCLLLTRKFFSAGHKRYFLAAVFVCGLMAGTVLYSGILVLLPLLIYFTVRPGTDTPAAAVKDLAAALGLLCAGALLVNPYWVISPGETLASLAIINNKTPTPYSPSSLYFLFRYGLGGGAAILFFTALFFGLRQWKALETFNRALLLFLAVVTLGLGKLPSDPGYSRYAIFIIPFFSLFAVDVLRTLSAQKYLRLLALAAVMLGAADAWRMRTYAVNDARGTTNTRLLAGEWLNANTGTAAIGHFCDLIPWTFPPVRLTDHRITVYASVDDLAADKELPEYLVTSGYQLYGLTGGQTTKFRSLYRLEKEFKNPVEVLPDAWRLFAMNMTISVYRRMNGPAGRRRAAP
ncbi:MAG: hypothetical protein NTY45_11200, partial [Elusimicrobia bacterium]|nr:hypothetical protein [Elusimicrobiota bacterium]